MSVATNSYKVSVNNVSNEKLGQLTLEAPEFHLVHENTIELTEIDLNEVDNNILIALCTCVQCIFEKFRFDFFRISRHISQISTQRLPKLCSKLTHQ